MKKVGKLPANNKESVDASIKALVLRGMRRRSTKAGKAASSIGGLTVSEIDAYLADLKEEWLDMLLLRKRRAKKEGINTPPPSPPDDEETEIETPGELAQKKMAVDGGLSELADAYLTHPESRYHKLQHATTRHYKNLIGRVREDTKDKKLSDLKAADFERLWNLWTKDGKQIAMGKQLITMVRMLVTFGMKTLGDRECERLAGVLHVLKFESVRTAPRTERLTEEDANKIRAKAKERGKLSIALAQAFQFDCGLLQKDVIGEWVPMSDPNPSTVLDGDKMKKWIRGIKWDEIDENLVLRHTSIEGPIEIDLKTARMVMEEIARIPESWKSGPIIVREKTGLPWTADAFRYDWRNIARECGISDNVKNMDTHPTANYGAVKKGNGGAEAPPH